ncbi:hypothetical protein [Litorihabitans aurantiacus]|uniref:hypothetical protein n=1 Tax=Litorihabitans aurantiacus TaxID=1930061 RepID=UPI0024E0AFC7|nr:hypothetical protein [Litorihabitans aurantiacus]
MSLTQHVDDKTSPVRRFFEERFPHVGELKYADVSTPPSVIAGPLGPLTITDLAAFSPGRAVALPVDGEGYPWRVAGTAFDYRLRLELGPLDLSTTTAFQGWDDKMRRPQGRAADSGWLQLVTALDALHHQLLTRGLDVDQERELARLCGVLALYEQAYRMGGILNPKVGDLPIWQLPPGAPLPELLALIDGRLADDVSALIALARDRAPALVRPTSFTGNPSFARSRDLRGADGDLVTDGTLIEVKCVQTAALGRRYGWQVLGYLLADTDDRHAITAVGWYFARQGYLWSFSVEEFLTRLAGRPVNIEEARAEFAQVCAAVAPRRRAPTPPEPGSVQRAVQLHPPASGRGKWHMTAEDVPWIAHGTYPPDDLSSPACGTSATLNLDAEPLSPPVGTSQADVAPQACRRCLLYSEEFYANRPD